MLGIIYLLLCTGLGYVVVNTAFPGLDGILDVSYRKVRIDASGLFVKVPLYFISGTMLQSWLTYILAVCLSDGGDPLKGANAVSMTVSACIILAYIIYALIRRTGSGNRTDIITSIRGRFQRETVYLKLSEAVIFTRVLCLGLILMYSSFAVFDRQMYVGYSVFSDFTPHISMIRSFSFMNNFPTQYSVCAGGDVKYHFMFTFLAGNLEYLGLRIDHAFNIPSVLAFLCSYLMLYSLALKITASRLTASFTLLLYTFRSSTALLFHLAGLEEGTILYDIFNNIEFIGVTNHEDWGLWNLNVYCNQRHFSFALSLLLFILILYLEPLYDAWNRLSMKECGFAGILKECFVSGEGWLPSKTGRAICTGLLLGAMGFFNGAVLLAVLMILFFIAIFADRRLEYLIIAAIATVLAFIQSKCFIDESAFDLKFRFGFLADNPTLPGVIHYLFLLLGILPVLLLISFCLQKAVSAYVMLCFSVPLVFSFLFSLTPDIAVNHKYIMISVMLLDIFAAHFIRRLFVSRGTFNRAVAVILLIILTSTGIYEFGIILRKNNYRNSITIDMDNPVTEWIRDNCDSDDLFLTANYFINGNPSDCGVIASGASLYDAWEYFGWSAGYFTSGRDRVVRMAFESEYPSELLSIVKRNGFDYAVIDDTTRNSDMFELNEEIFDRTFEVAYEAYFGDALTKIYDLNRPK